MYYLKATLRADTPAAREHQTQELSSSASTVNGLATCVRTAVWSLYPRVEAVPLRAVVQLIVERASTGVLSARPLAFTIGPVELEVRSEEKANA